MAKKFQLEEYNDNTGGIPLSLLPNTINMQGTEVPQPSTAAQAQQKKSTPTPLPVQFTPAPSGYSAVDAPAPTSPALTQAETDRLMQLAQRLQTTQTADDKDLANLVDTSSYSYKSASQAAAQAETDRLIQAYQQAQAGQTQQDKSLAQSIADNNNRLAQAYQTAQEAQTAQDKALAQQAAQSRAAAQNEPVAPVADPSALNLLAAGTAGTAGTGNTGKSSGGSTGGTSSTGQTAQDGGEESPVSDEAYQAALAALQKVREATPVYENSYQAQLQDLYNEIVGRKPFQYDLNGDMLYQQYADQYRDMGRLAMQDTMGRAAALTGGYGSTYGQTVGQQQYDAYLQRLNDVIPDLYNSAYQAYNDQGDRMLQQYSMLGDMADDEYQKYLDRYGQWLTERDYATEMEDMEYNRYKQALAEYEEKKAAEEAAAQAARRSSSSSSKKTTTQQSADNAVVKAGPGTYNLTELTDAAAAGMTKAQIEEALRNRGVNVSDASVQADIKWALSR